MTLIFFKKKYRCFVCGRVVTKSKDSMPFCCGQAMSEKDVDVPEEVTADFKIDLVKPIVQVIAKPEWLDQREVWSIRREGDSGVSKIRVGTIGKLANGTYEFVMEPGFTPQEGVGFTMQDTVQRMVEIVIGR